MRTSLVAMAIGAAAALSIGAAYAQPTVHHHRLHHVVRTYAAPPGAGIYYGYAPYYYSPYYGDPGAAVLSLTERAQHEPGVTGELAPDAKQTASGGPVGGIPGFSGGH